MKNIMLSIAVLLTVVAPSAFAHPGHDHSHWMSSSIHWVTAASLLAVVAIVATALTIRSKKAKQDK